MVILGGIIKVMRAVITGASQGIGLALARSLQQAGWSLVLWSRDEAKLSQVASELGAEWCAVDVTDPAAVALAAEKTLAGGSIDAIINNAGVGSYGAVVDYKIEDWQNLINVNLTGPFLVTRALLPALIKQQSGFVVNMGSRHSYEVSPERTAYCASKFGLRGFSLSLEQELKPHHIAVTIIEPHSVLTNFNNALADKERRAASGEPFLTPEQVADTVKELLTGEREWASEVRLEIRANGQLAVHTA